MLARRRLLQLSIFDMLLVTAAVTALMVSYVSLAPRTVVYTAAFLGGLLGSAVAMNRQQPQAWQIVVVGTSVGVLAGWIAAIFLEALWRGIPFESDWMHQFRRGRVPATHFATAIGLVGGLTASTLSTLLFVFKSWLVQERGRLNKETV